MVERVRTAAKLVGIDFVSVRATTEVLAAQLLPVTREESSDDDVVLTHVETPRSKAKASLAEAVRTGAVVQIDDSEPRRPPAWYTRTKHLAARKLVVSLIESRLRTLARGGVCVVRNARNFPRAARLIEFRLLCEASSLPVYRDAKTLAARVRTELRRLRDRAPAAAPAPAAAAAPTAAPAPSPPASETAPVAKAPTGPAAPPAPAATLAPAQPAAAPAAPAVVVAAPAPVPAPAPAAPAAAPAPAAVVVPAQRSAAAPPSATPRPAAAAPAPVTAPEPDLAPTQAPAPAPAPALAPPAPVAPPSTALPAAPPRPPAPSPEAPPAVCHLPAAPPPPPSSWLPPARVRLAPGVVVDCRGPAGGSAGARRAPAPRRRRSRGP